MELVMTNEFTYAGSWECDAMLATVIEADRTLLQVADEHDGQFLVFTVKEAQSFRDWLNRVLPAHEPCEQLPVIENWAAFARESQDPAVRNMYADFKAVLQGASRDASSGESDE
jgi:hypothetical protein